MRGMEMDKLMIAAQNGVAMGLVNRVVPPEEMLDTALASAGEICQCAFLAVQAIKKSTRRSQGVSLDQALWCENALGLPLYDTQDYEEGRKAFGEKRQPRFQAK